jgi:hypothetical protein
MKTRLLFLIALLLACLPAEPVTVFVPVRDFTSGPVVNRNVTVTLTRPNGPAVAGPWLLPGDTVTKFTDSNGTAYFSNMLAVGEYRVDIGGNPSRSFPFSLDSSATGIVSLVNIINLFGTNVSVQKFYNSDQIDSFFSLYADTNGMPSNMVAQVVYQLTPGITYTSAAASARIATNIPDGGTVGTMEVKTNVDGTTYFRINGHTIVAYDGTNWNATFPRNVTAAKYYGDGSNLTGVGGTNGGNGNVIDGGYVGTMLVKTNADGSTYLTIAGHTIVFYDGTNWGVTFPRTVKAFDFEGDGSKLTGINNIGSAVTLFQIISTNGDNPILSFVDQVHGTVNNFVSVNGTNLVTGSQITAAGFNGSAAGLYGYPIPYGGIDPTNWNTRTTNTVLALAATVAGGGTASNAVANINGDATNLTVWGSLTLNTTNGDTTVSNLTATGTITGNGYGITNVIPTGDFFRQFGGPLGNTIGAATLTTSARYSSESNLLRRA